MVFSVSPSVTIREIDATASIPSVSTGPGAIAGVFHWGPVNERTLITSESNLVSRFGKPSDFNAETFFTAADFLAYSKALYVVRVADGANTASLADNTFKAKYPGALGNSIRVSTVTGPNAYESSLFGVGEVSAGLTFGSTSIEFNAAPTLALAVNDTLKLGNTSIGYQQLNVKSLSTTPVNSTVTTYTVTSDTRYNLVAENMSTLSASKLWGYRGNFNTKPDAGKFHMVVADKDGKISGKAGTVLEMYENVSTTATDKLEDGTSNFYKDVITARSAWIAPSTVNVSTASDVSVYGDMSGGLDGNSESAASFGVVAQGYDRFKNAEDVDISFVLTGKTKGGTNGTGLANYIIANVTDYRKDCIAYVSPEMSDVVGVANDEDKLTNVLAFRGSMQTSTYSFVDSGYKYRYDKYNDKYRWTPLNGDTAGLSARVDPWISPAGYKRGVVKNVVKLAYSPNKQHRDQLYGMGVNPVMTQAGSGTLLFGDKTGLGIPTSAFNYINVRRLFITVEKVIATASKFELFELNNETTQARFKNMVEPYLRDIQGKQGIIDFRVIVDSTVNTPEVIDAGKFRANIFIKPARSIQEIELTFVATRTSVEFDEIVGKAL